MKITDMNGQDIEIDNLQLAIMQANDYRHMKHLNPEMQVADAKLQAYWNDIYQKLIRLQT